MINMQTWAMNRMEEAENGNEIMMMLNWIVDVYYRNLNYESKDKKSKSSGSQQFQMNRR